MNKLINGYKFCPKCETSKEECEFYVEKGKYLSHRCKECLKKDTRTRNENKTEEQKLREKEVYKEYYNKNRERYKESRKEYREKFPERNKGFKLRDAFGITLEDYNEMLKKQDGKCAGCGREPDVIDPRTGKIKALCVDHCHKSGKIRKLLCNKCNSILGYADDKIETLQNLIKILEEFK